MTALAASPIPDRLDRQRTLLFTLFFVSGFCGLLYQVVWLRMAFAHFGIVTPVLSVVVSVFMAGLGLGSVIAGRWGDRVGIALGVSPAILYGVAELGIAAGALFVPAQMQWSEARLLAAGGAGTMSYLALSGVAIILAILPSCFLMGTTYPLMMSFMRSTQSGDGQSFSFLYRANVVGATLGTLASAFVLIELLGFKGTSLVAAALNVAIALVSFRLGHARRPSPGRAIDTPAKPDATPARSGIQSWPRIILFTTGFCSLGMEVVWTRAFTIVLETTIYAFALILAVYLLATALGAADYRQRLRQGRVPGDASLLVASALSAILPALVNDPRLQASAVGVLLSIVPFCYVLGLLTPKLIDAASGGDPNRAGQSYAINVLGSILGPLFAGYVLVSTFDPRICMLILAAPLLALAAWAIWRATTRPRSLVVGLATSMLALVFGTLVSRSYETLAFSKPHVVHRDHAATAIGFGEGMNKRLLVNGVGITHLTPITKLMAHLPLAARGNAGAGLVICFGMGTTARSMASWGIQTTAVDLTASVIDSFPFFHSDAEAVIANPKVRLVVDDGRRFLSRSHQSFDVIVIDPPPPIVAAGSSLLYSQEMYDIVKRRLRPGGILQQWFPGGDDDIGRAVARTLAQSFPYVVAYRSIEDIGVHYLASMEPIPDLTPGLFVERLPELARRDLVEWGDDKDALSVVHKVLSLRVPMTAIAPDLRGMPIISDNRPYNEYFFVRKILRAIGVSARITP